MTGWRSLLPPQKKMMNWVDLVILVLLAFFVIEGFSKSFISELLDFFSFLLAFILSVRFYNLPALFFENNFQIPHSLSNVLGFATAWFLVETVFLGITPTILLKIPAVSKINKLTILTIIPSLFKGLVLVTVLLLLIGTFPVQPKVKIAVEDSQIGSKILGYARNLEMPLKNIFGGITTDSLTFLTIKPKSDERVALGFQTDQFYPSEVLENRMIELVNKERVNQGFKPLTFNAKLKEVARSHSADMFKRGYFSHYSPEGKSVAERAENYGVEYLVIGENLAYAPNLELAHSGLMNSPGHRANILSPDFNEIGIGIMDGGVYGLMVTQVFTN
ncbi:CvpA family protein [Candidatus Daviesbacteria bacterium]|nr:CvpA family protein [Candidatus Daviesbacteria bacterium]